MPVAFSRSLRALHADPSWGTSLALAAGLLVLVAWGAWMVLARVPVYAVAGTARLEAGASVHHVDAPLSGRVVAVAAVLDGTVPEGAVLFELDAEAQRLALAGAEAEQASLAAQLDALRREHAAGSLALAQAQEAGEATLAEARARCDEAEAAARAAEADAERLAQLHARQYTSTAEYERAVAEARQRRAAAEALRLGLQRRALDLRREYSDRRVALDKTLREAARIEGALAAAGAAVERLRHEHGSHRVTAPVAGRLGEVAPLRVGAYVEAGDRLASVVPAGTVRAVARFAPSTAVGRLRPGQPARLRLDGFPWTQYGTVPATVARVANEAEDGQVRVELDVAPGANPSIPLQHGLPGTVEVEVERLSPAALVLRKAGKLLRPS